MRTVLSLLVLTMVAACSPDYPMDKPGTWSLSNQPSSNDANLRAMIVNPHDLDAGTGETTTIGREATEPVKRLLTGQRYPLPPTDSMIVDQAPVPAATPSNGGNANVSE